MMQPIKLEAILPHLWISGRSSRAEWWRVHIVCAVLAAMIEHMMFAQLAPRDGGSMQPISLLWPIASLALMWVSFASVARRFRDRGKSGWWALLYFVPGIGWMWILIECGFLPGKPAVQAAPAFTPAPEPARPAPMRASRSAARLQAAPRVGTVQRVGAVQRAEDRPWGGKRTVKFAGQAVSFGLAAATAFMLYKLALDPSGQAIFTNLNTTFTE